jgi:hypothetical protein
MGRPIRPNLQSSSEDVFAQIQSWIFECGEQHERCRFQCEQVLPTRVIYLGESRGTEPPRLVLGEEKRARYATISHRWNLNKLLRTTLSTIEGYTQAIPLDTGPQSWQDAVAILRHIDIRYLWIDALCIVQDDRIEAQRELAQLGRYFKNTSLNIVAGIAHHSDGLLGLRVQPQILPCRLPQPSDMTRNSSSEPISSLSLYHGAEDDHGPIYLGWLGSEAYFNPAGKEIRYYPDHWRYVSPVHARAWQVQEHRLAPRNLVFQDDQDRLVTSQLYLQCQQRVIWENGRWREKKEDEVDRRLDWYRLVEEYSGRILTYQSDMLIAISAVAKEYQLVFPGHYYCGIWEKDMIRGLLWYRTGGVEHSQNFLSPSWSWACGEGLIKHYWPADVNIQADFVVASTVFKLSDHSGKVGSDYITLRGFLQPLRSVSVASHLDLIIDFETESPQRPKTTRARIFLDSHDDVELITSPLSPVFVLAMTARCGLLVRQLSPSEGDSCEPYHPNAYRLKEAHISSGKRVGLLVLTRSDTGCLRGGQESTITIW